MAIVLTRLVFQEIVSVLERDDFVAPKQRDPPSRVVTYYFRDADNPRLRGQGLLQTRFDPDEPHVALLERVSREAMDQETGAQATEGERLKTALSLSLAPADAIAAGPMPMPAVIGGKP